MRLFRLHGSVSFSFGSVLLFWIATACAAPRLAEPISPIVAQPVAPADIPIVDLGEKLFHSRLLSGDMSQSCASCHDLKHLGGSDGRPKSIGTPGHPGKRRTPSIFNVSNNFVQLWDGRAATLEDQIQLVIHDKSVMNSDWKTVLARLNTDPTLRPLFESAYGTEANAENVKDSIAAYERTLTTPDSRFDRYLQGDDTAITLDELRGYTLFKQYGCASCHQGVNVGGNMFQPLGVIGEPGAYFREIAGTSAPDQGRFAITGDIADKFVFRVPSLRNVALRPPYFNDGSVPTLDLAVQLMGRYQLGRSLDDNDVKLIVKFLGTLTGSYRGEPLDKGGRQP
ncbi:cytochrome-c peroxidase [Bordetella tumulicola]|uniref:cytochrome-c peroxidase n=1 Tax=Bordetella tumulicola TaxID=1649133 RepID=UPI0039EEB8A6